MDPSSLTISEPAEPNDSTLFALLPSIWARTQQAASSPSSSASQILAALRQDYDTYRERIDRCVTELRGRLAGHAELLAEERRVFTEANEKFRADVEASLAEKSLKRKIAAQMGAAAGNTGHAPSRTPPIVIDKSATNSATSSTTSESDMLIGFWKAQHSKLQHELDAMDEELSTISEQVSDAQFTAGGEQHKLQCMIGLLREKEATERERANAYRALLAELRNQPAASPTSKKQPTPAAAAPAVESRATTLSVIEAGLVALEESALDAVAQTLDAEIAALRDALAVRASREKTLRARIAESAAQQKPQLQSIDATLEIALDLRGKVAAIRNQAPPLEGAADTRNVAQLQAQAATLRNEIETTKRALAEVEASMQQALRERRVQMIRALHMASEDPDARFTRLKSEQCVTVVSRQIAEAEEEKRRLMRLVDSAATEAKLSAQFLSRCK